jgi:hypothetical protein
LSLVIAVAPQQLDRRDRYQSAECSRQFLGLVKAACSSMLWGGGYPCNYIRALRHQVSELVRKPSSDATLAAIFKCRDDWSTVIIKGKPNPAAVETWHS